MVEIYGNTIWHNATSNAEKTILNIPKNNLQSILSVLESSAVNYCYYIQNDICCVAVNSSDVQKLTATPEMQNIDKSSPRKASEPKNIIGNTNYHNIKDKEYQKLNTDLALKVAEMLNNSHIPFSGRVYGKNTTLTVNKSDKEKLQEIIQAVQSQRNLFQKDIESVNSIYNEMMKYQYTDEQKAALLPAINLCYQKGESLSSTMLSDIENISSYSIEQLTRYSEAFVTSYESLSEYEFIFGGQEVRNLKEQVEKELLFDRVTRLRGYNQEQKEAIQHLINNNVSETILEILDYNFSPDELREVADISHGKNVFENLCELVSEVKHIELNALHNQFRLNTYMPDTAEIFWFMYDTENAGILDTKKGKIAEIEIEPNRGLWNRLAEHGLLLNENSEQRILLETDGKNWNKIVIPDVFGNLTNSIDVSEILTSDELSVMQEISEKVLSGFYSQLEFEQSLPEQRNEVISAPVEQKSESPTLKIDYSKDLFFLNKDTERITLLQYNPDSDSGGQFISTDIYYNQIQEAAQKFGNSPTEFFDYIISVGKHNISDVGTDWYKSDLEIYSSNTHSFEGLTLETMIQLVNLSRSEISKSEFIAFASGILCDNIRIKNAHENSSEQEYRLETEHALNELVTELTTASVVDSDFVITGYTAKEVINFLNQYQNNIEMQNYILNMVSENIDIALTGLEKTKATAKELNLPFSDKFYDGSDIDPYVYDGSMSPEDTEKRFQMMANEYEIKVKDNLSENQRPTITCEWSESPVFEDGKTYSVAEFDRIMKQADDERIKGTKAAIQKYGSREAWYNSDVQDEYSRFYGYDKVKFTINMPDGTSFTERQDIGDGDGGVIDFLKQYSQYSEVVKILEADIQENDIPYFRIYQIKDNAKYRGIRFESYADNRKQDATLNKEDYELVYEGKWNDIEGFSSEEKLENIFKKFNTETPSDFTGHSLSVSDVVTVGNSQTETAYYVDRLGYTDFQQFFMDKDISVKAEQKPENKTAKVAEKTFAEQIDEVLSGKASRFNDLKVCDTPQILLDVGCRQLPMFYTRNHLKKAILPKDRKKHQHGLTVEQIKKIPDKLISPVIIMDSLTQNNSVIAVLSDVDSENNPIIVSIKPNGQGFYELEMQESNFITSIYGRENFEEFINRAINNDKILFIDKEKSQALFSVLGLEFSKGLNSLDFDIIIHQSRNIVNENIVEKKHTSEEQLSFDNINSDKESRKPNEQKGTQELSDNNFMWTTGGGIDEHAPTSVQPTLFDLNGNTHFGKDSKTAEPTTVPAENTKNYVIESRENIKRFQPNYRITDDNIGAGTQGQRFQANISAITLLKQLEAENRSATSDEQAILAKYVGWGGLSEYFKENNPHYEELKGLLTESEYASALASTLDSFYTPPIIIDSIYSVLENSGFIGGNILEPAMGIGNFFGKIPDSINQNSKLYGVELDSISGRIAKQLYPNANITIKGFEKTRFQNNSFDVVLGNVPFGSSSISDKDYDKSMKIHDYFFMKSLDKVKPGGIIAFVTSTGTLDKKDSSFREELAKQADLLGAVRLPSQSFKANAGTDVDADIIFLQKKEQPIDVSRSMPNWINLGETENGIIVNKYFEDNPQMILGEMTEGNKLYGKGTICMPTPGDLSQKLKEAVGNIHATFTAVQSEIEPLQNSEIELPDNLRNYSIFAQNNNIYYLENDNITCFSEIWGKKYNEKNIERAKSYIEIRDTVRELLTIQQINEPDVDSKIHNLQIKLNTLYDDFNTKYGLINNAYNKQLFRKDVSFPLMLSLEEVKDNKLIRKSDIFTKRTIRVPEVIDKVDTPLEALTLSVVEKGKVDIDYMSSLTDMPKETIIDKLKGEIYPVPELSTDDNIVYQTASEYLSGDIYAKINSAEIESKNNSIYYDNISELKSAIPTPLKAGDIDVQLGATWIPIEYYQQFMYELFKTPDENRADRPARYRWQEKDKRDIAISYSPYTGRWNISNKSVDRSVTVTKTYGTEKRNAYAILESILNLQNPKVNKIVWKDGEKKTELDIEATKIAEQRANLITEAFRDWIFKNPTRRNELVDLYNRQFNCIRPREYDGSAMTFPGMSASIELHEHQKNAIAHAIHGGNTLFAHCVGAGKTFEMIATAMESKRLGLCNKSLFAVPNHLTEQFGADFLKLYPAANILVATKDDFTAKNRSKLLAKISTGNYDAVIIGHSQLSMIPLSPERQEEQYKQQIADITQGIEQLEAENGESFQVKQMERTKKSLEQKLEKLSASKKDNTVYFEELGIDKLFVDEAHEFKNLMCVTKLQNVSGISGKSSQRALELFMKCQYLDEITGGKGVVFATGTPISNSITELHTMMRYLQYDFLKQHGIQNFDNWVSTFGKQKTDYELAPTGDRFKIRTRIAEYANMPELMSMFKQVADVRTSDTIKLNVPECELHIVNTEPTDIQQEMVKELSDRADDVNTGAVDPREDNMLKITSDGRKAALDPRLVNPTLPDDPDTKLNQCVRNVLQIYQETSEQKLTQIIFCDLGVPKPQSKDGENISDNEQSIAEMDSLEDYGRFCVYDDIKNKLIAQGVPANEIAFIHNAKTEQQKAELFAKVRSGEVRVLIGSTAKMGTGTNVQDRLIALHDLDVPWRPSDLEQRRGRIVRQGNINSKVHLYRYVTKGTFDAYSYQLLENKQKFISQIITSKSPARKCSDVDQEALTYAEIKALCTADERIKEQLILNNRVKELKMLKSEYTNTHYELEDKLLEYPIKREVLCQRIENISTDFERCKQIPVGADGLPIFELKIGNTTYTDRKEAAKALEYACNRAIAQHIDELKPIGSIYGFDFALTYEEIGKPANATILGSESYKISLNSMGHYSLNKLENAIFSIENQLTLHQKQLNKLDTDMSSAKEILNKPFEFEDELSEKEARLFDLTRELKAEQAKAAKQETKKERTHYFGKDKILGCFRKNKPKENNSLEKGKNEVSR